MSEDERIAATMDPEWPCPTRATAPGTAIALFTDKPSRSTFYRQGTCHCTMDAGCPCREYSSSRRAAKAAGE